MDNSNSIKQEEKLKRVFGVGFCGSGIIVFDNHKPNLEKKSGCYKIIGFFDIVMEKAQQLAGTSYKVYSSYENLLTDKDVDIVVIATKPLQTHFCLAKQALEAGKDVVLEKPMAVSSSECDQLVALAKQKGKMLTVHQNRRLDLDFLAVVDVIKKGKVGEPRLILNSNPCDSYEPGDIVDWGVHLIDQALVLNRNPLKEISSIMYNPEGGLEKGGYFEATLRFERPPVIRVSMLPRPQEFLLNGTPALIRFLVIGTRGSFAQRIIEDPRDLMNATQNFSGCRPDYAVPEYLKIVQNEYYDYLYAYLTGSGSLLVKPEEARNAIRVLELIAESARLNKTVKAEGMVPVDQ